jgi:hypothetical protein
MDVLKSHATNKITLPTFIMLSKASALASIKQGSDP